MTAGTIGAPSGDSRESVSAGYWVLTRNDIFEARQAFSVVQPLEDEGGR